MSTQLVSGRILSELGAALTAMDTRANENGVTFTGDVTVYNLDGEPVRFTVEFGEEDELGVHYAEVILL